MNDMEKTKDKENSKDKFNENKIITKRDLMLIIILLAVMIILFLFMYLNKKTGYNVRISADGKTIKTLSLDKDEEYVFEVDKGYNVVVIKNNEVYVKEADCPDKICVKHKKISNIGETIICLPHKLVVEITK